MSLPEYLIDIWMCNSISCKVVLLPTFYVFPCYHTNPPEFSNYTCKKRFPRLHLNSSFVFIFSRVKDRKTLLERPTSCFIFAPLFTNDVTVFVFTFIRGHVLLIEWLKYYNDRRYGYILMFRNCFTSLQASEN